MSEPDGADLEEAGERVDVAAPSNDNFWAQRPGLSSLDAHYVHVVRGVPRTSDRHCVTEFIPKKKLHEQLGESETREKPNGACLVDWTEQVMTGRNLD